MNDKFVQYIRIMNNYNVTRPLINRLLLLKLEHYFTHRRHLENQVVASASIQKITYVMSALSLSICSTQRMHAYIPVLTFYMCKCHMTIIIMVAGYLPQYQWPFSLQFTI